jgi:hypothetical protein
MTLASAEKRRADRLRRLAGRNVETSSNVRAPEGGDSIAAEPRFVRTQRDRRALVERRERAR